MSKRGNYFIAMYDINDNYIRDFESIEECALYFNKTNNNIRNYLFRKKKILNKYNLYKIENLPQHQFNQEKSIYITLYKQYVVL